MGVGETLLHEVVRRVLTVARPDKIILFGSAATGRMTADSDIDLLVVESEPENTRDRSVKIRRALGNVQYPIDVIVISRERFEETKDIIGGIALPANKYGRVLYEAEVATSRQPSSFGPNQAGFGISSCSIAGRPRRNTGRRSLSATNRVP